MSYVLTVREEAELDIDQAFENYQEKREGLGHDFLLCIEEAFEKLQRNPLIYRKIFGEVRRLPIKRFPYRVFYKLHQEKIIVIAVFHIRKDPSSWPSRT